MPAKEYHERLTNEEFVALKEVADKPTHHTISDEHRDRLIAAGYIREVVRHSGAVYALVPTGKGLRRLRSAGWSSSSENISQNKDVRSNSQG
jgi:hypothetical protein